MAPQSILRLRTVITNIPTLRKVKSLIVPPMSTTSSNTAREQVKSDILQDWHKNVYKTSSANAAKSKE